MKAATINEIKQELLNLPNSNLIDLCVRLSRFKKENKELLTYLLFESNDIDDYIQNIKKEIDFLFLHINKSNVYFVKKTLRKILRNTSKYIRYSSSIIVEIELLIHFCNKIIEQNISIFNSTMIANIYNNQIKKILKSISTLHEDLQYDYFKQIEVLQNYKS